MLATSSKYLNGLVTSLPPVPSLDIKGISIGSLPDSAYFKRKWNGLKETVDLERLGAVSRYLPSRLPSRLPSLPANMVPSLPKGMRLNLQACVQRYFDQKRLVVEVKGKGVDVKPLASKLLFPLPFQDPAPARPCLPPPPQPTAVSSSTCSSRYFAFDPLGRSAPSPCSPSYVPGARCPPALGSRRRRRFIARVHATPSATPGPMESLGEVAIASTGAASTAALSSGVVAKAAANLVGWGVLLGSCLRSVPQIMRIWKKQSVEGISLMSTVAEMVAYTVICGYNVYHRYPFSSFGDTAMCLLQDVILLGLFCKFGSLHPSLGVAGLLVLGGVAHWVGSGSCGGQVLSGLQAGSMLLLSLGSRLPQILMNWRRGNTGELSLFTSLLNFSGNVARLFTTSVLTGDALIMAGTGLQTLMNGIMVGQIWSSNRKRLEEERRATKAKDAHQEPASPGPERSKEGAQEAQGIRSNKLLLGSS